MIPTRVSFPALLAVLALPVYLRALGQEAAQPAKVKATKHAEPESGLHVTASGGAGLGVFQDIQVPVNEDAQMRGDGKVVSDENADHMGFPVHGGLGLRYESDKLALDVLSFDVLQMRATTGPAETQSSSYSRLDLGAGARYGFDVDGGYELSLGLKGGIRRSSWNNISAAHYIQAIVVGGSLGLRTASGFALEGFANTGVNAQFGYSEAAFLGGRPFEKSTASLSEVGLTASFPIHERVWLDTGVEQEHCTATIDDVNEYNGFGLNVEDPARPSRSYDLATNILRFGVRKEF